MVLESRTGAKLQVKIESHFPTEKSTSFYSEFYEDSEYVILSEKYFGQKNGLIDTCSLYENDFLSCKKKFINY